MTLPSTVIPENSDVPGRPQDKDLPIAKAGANALLQRLVHLGDLMQSPWSPTEAIGSLLPTLLQFYGDLFEALRHHGPVLRTVREELIAARQGRKIYIGERGSSSVIDALFTLIEDVYKDFFVFGLRDCHTVAQSLAPAGLELHHDNPHVSFSCGVFRRVVSRILCGITISDEELRRYKPGWLEFYHRLSGSEEFRQLATQVNMGALCLRLRERLSHALLDDMRTDLESDFAVAAQERQRERGRRTDVIGMAAQLRSANPTHAPEEPAPQTPRVHRIHLGTTTHERRITDCIGLCTPGETPGNAGSQLPTPPGAIGANEPRAAQPRQAAPVEQTGSGDTIGQLPPTEQLSPTVDDEDERILCALKEAQPHRPNQTKLEGLSLVSRKTISKRLLSLRQNGLVSFASKGTNSGVTITERGCKLLEELDRKREAEQHYHRHPPRTQ
jgi:hypothetical protein